MSYPTKADLTKTGVPPAEKAFISYIISILGRNGNNILGYEPLNPIKSPENPNKPHLVGGFKPSERYWSVGMIIPNIWKNKIHVPNHQPVIESP